MPLLVAPPDLIARAEVLSATFAPGATSAPVDPPTLDAARAAQGEGRIADAATILLALLRDPARAGEGALGLAVLALGQDDPADAEAFARFCLDRGERSARACAIAGVAALERGDRGEAQRLLSASARIARTNQDAVDDLRGAQRVLLLMQLGPR